MRMIVRFGYVAMSVEVKNASPSKTMTWTRFSKLEDRAAALRLLERIAAENLHNTLRLLRHNRAHGIRLYRCSSRLIPLFGHEALPDWDPISALAEPFAAIGDYARRHAMRLSFHPDHYTVLSTPRADVFARSVADLDRHTRMLEAMGLDESAKLNIHIGGTYGNKKAAMARFLKQFAALDPRIVRRITLENDDKTFTASETLAVAEQLGVPMVLDLHHDQVNPSEEAPEALWPRIRRTWEGAGAVAGEPLPPKIHVSSPRSEADPRSHADYVEAGPLIGFLRRIAAATPRLDVMIEAKMKDAALFRLLDDLAAAGVGLLDGTAAVEIFPG
jgi:UV DNA damage endonuclease